MIILLLNAVSILSEDRFLARSALYLCRHSLKVTEVAQLVGEGRKETRVLAAETTLGRKREVWT